MHNSSSSDKEITVNVRSTSFNDTLEVKTTVDSDIGTLKRSLETMLPNHPLPQHQRIIHRGNLLLDTDYLKDILKKTDDDVHPTFHLVVKPALRNHLHHQQQLQQQQQKNLAESSSTAMSGVPSTSSASSNQQEHQSTLPQPSIQPFPQPQHAPHQSSFINNSQQQQQPTEQPAMSAPSSMLPGGYQVILINGQYYLAPVLTTAQPLTLAPQIFQQPQSQPQQPSYVIPESPQVEPQQQQQQRQFNDLNDIRQYVNNLFNNNNQQQQRERPILIRQGMGGMFQRATSIWLAIKLMIVLFMVCQGASIERIFIFHTIAFVFFLYQTGRLRFVIRRVRAEDANTNRNQRPEADPQQQPQQPQQQPPPHAENNNTGTAATSTAVNHEGIDNNLNQRRDTNQGREDASSAGAATDNNDRQQPADQQFRRATALDTWKRGVFAFFASLWPSYGADPRIAQAFENDNDDNNNNNQR